MVKVLGDIGLQLSVVTAMDAVIPVLTDHQNVKLVVVNQPSNGKTLILYAIHDHHSSVAGLKMVSIKIYNINILGFHLVVTLTVLCPRYHVPRSWLKPTQNSLVLFEELGGDPAKISLVKRSVTGVCADISEYHPNIKNWQIESYGKTQEFHMPKLHLRCSQGQSITSIKFASFGTPSGTCGSFQQGTCHALTSYATLEKVGFNFLYV